MIEFVAANWGSLASAVGLIVTILIALGARSASRAAHKAARQTGDRIVRYLQTVDLVRAIGLIQRIKLLHDTERWESAMEQYQDLRRMLSDIIARCPESQAELRDKLATGRTAVSSTEDLVGNRDNQPITAQERARMNRLLNEIQGALEELASAIGFGDSPGEAK